MAVCASAARVFPSSLAHDLRAHTLISGRKSHDNLVLAGPVVVTRAEKAAEKAAEAKAGAAEEAKAEAAAAEGGAAAQGAAGVGATQHHLPPMLREQEVKYIMRPDASRMAVWNMYKAAVACLWTANEVQLSEDVKQWRTVLSADERHFLKYILAFFAASDGIVNENIMCNFAQEVTWMEAKAFYAQQAFIETIHGEVYSNLIHAFVTDRAEQDMLFRAIEGIPCIRRKADWTKRWMDRRCASFAERLVAFACVEGIFFSGSFCAIYWFKQRNLLPGTSFSNELISRDENMHCEFACLLYSMLPARFKLSQARIHDIVGSAVDCEREFITEAIPVSLIGMNNNLMAQYIKFTADRLLVQLGAGRLFHVANPFDWMELMCVRGKTNFFEKRVSEYAKASADSGEGDATTSSGFDMDADF